MSNNERIAMQAVIAIVVAIVIMAIAVTLSDYAESALLEQSCYVIMYTEAQIGDTWYSIANHWGMSASTLKAMNPTIKVPYWRSIPVGTSIKLAVWAGC